MLSLALALAALFGPTAAPAAGAATSRDALPEAPPAAADTTRPAFPFGPTNAYDTGLWGNAEAWPFNSTSIIVEPGTVIETLERARAAGVRLMINLVGSKKQCTKPDGTFDLERWKERVRRFEGIDFAPWVEDGTILAHYLLDEPHAKGRWGGERVPYEVLEELGRFSAERWPTMPTAIRSETSWLAAAPFAWRHVDAGIAQYSARKGDPTRYLANEVAAGRAAGLGVMIGLNPISGGDGSSALASDYDPDAWMMSGDELLAYGTVLLSHPYVCSFQMWKWEDEEWYWARPEIRAAVERLRRLATDHAASPCRVRAGGGA